MIAKHRNKGIIRLAISIVLFAIMGVAFHRMKPFRANAGDFEEVVAVLAYFSGVGFWGWGSYELALAKGYHRGEAPLLILIGCLCAPIIFLVLPLIILFAFKDKTQSGYRHTD